MEEKEYSDMYNGMKSAMVRDLYSSLHTMAHLSTRFEVVVKIELNHCLFAIQGTVYINGGEHRQQIFDILKKHFEENYGLHLINQRFYTAKLTMDFNANADEVTCEDIYTLLKIRQLI